MTAANLTPISQGVSPEGMEPEWYAGVFRDGEVLFSVGYERVDCLMGIMDKLYPAARWGRVSHGVGYQGWPSRGRWDGSREKLL